MDGGEFEAYFIDLKSNQALPMLVENIIRFDERFAYVVNDGHTSSTWCLPLPFTKDKEMAFRLCAYMFGSDSENAQIIRQSLRLFFYVEAEYKGFPHDDPDSIEFQRILKVWRFIDACVTSNKATEMTFLGRKIWPLSIGRDDEDEDHEDKD